MPGIGEGEIARRCRFAAAFNLLSIGVPFFQAGEEMLRSKKKRDGKFDLNSYRSPDSVNSIKWSRLDDPEVQKTLHYYQGLIALRREHTLFRISDAAEADRCITLVENTAPQLTAFRLENEAETILTLFNPCTDSLPFSLPKGSWKVCVIGESADPQGLEERSGEIQIPSISALVAIAPKVR